MGTIFPEQIQHNLFEGIVMNEVELRKLREEMKRATARAEARAQQRVSSSRIWGSHPDTEEPLLQLLKAARHAPLE